MTVTIPYPDHRPQIGTVHPSVFKKSTPSDTKAEVVREEFYVVREQTHTPSS